MIPVFPSKFLEKSYWKFDEKNEKMVYGYPKSVYEWKGVPAFPADAVLQGQFLVLITNCSKQKFVTLVLVETERI